MANQQLEKAIAMITDAFRTGGKLMVCGNGGSASDSAHIVGELVKGFLKKRPLPAEWAEELGGAPLQMGLPAMDLTAQGAAISAIVNDLGGECMYAQQVLAYGVPGDVLLGISTSGNSGNVLYAADVARAMGIHVIGLTGQKGGKLALCSDVCIKAPSTETYVIQEYHLPIYHALCLALEEQFFGE